MECFLNFKILNNLVLMGDREEGGKSYFLFPEFGVFKTIKLLFTLHMKRKIYHFSY